MIHEQCEPIKNLDNGMMETIGEVPLLNTKKLLSAFSLPLT